MTIQAKQNLVSGVEEQIGDFLTVTMTHKVSAVLSDTLEGYEVEEIRSDELNTELVEEFLNAKKVEGRSAKTIARYSYVIEKTLTTIGVSPGQVTTSHLRTFFAEEKARGLSDRSLDGVRQVLSSFFTWLWKEGLIKSNPITPISVIKSVKKVRLPFTQVDIVTLKDHCHSLRDKAIICFMLSTGARISEICALNVEDIDFQNLECTVLGKGNKERVVFLDEVTAMMLKTYISQRAATDKDPLFIGRFNERLTPGGIRYMLKILEEESGIANVHPHRFRRTFATNLISHGMPIQEVAMLLGHETIDTTMTYVYIDKTSVKNSYRRYI